MRVFIILIALLFLAYGCAPKENLEEEVFVMKIESPNFNEGNPIPSEFTCDGKDLSPELVFKDVPEKAQSMALIMDDPDAPRGTFVHWLVWNIPPMVRKFIKGEKIKYVQGMSDFGRTGYGGPCPPSGAHRYFFKLYALDIILDLDEGSSKEDLENAMKGHVVAEAKLIGVYKRV